MPGYELSLILRVLKREETANVLKATCSTVLQNGGVVRSLQNIGTRRLPYRMRNHGIVHKEGQYFVMEFDSPVSALENVKKQLEKDEDIIRPHVIRRTEEVDRPCNHRPCDFGELTTDIRKKVIRDLSAFVKKV